MEPGFFSSHYPIIMLRINSKLYFTDFSVTLSIQISYIKKHVREIATEWALFECKYITHLEFIPVVFEKENEVVKPHIYLILTIKCLMTWNFILFKITQLFLLNKRSSEEHLVHRWYKITGLHRVNLVPFIFSVFSFLALI